MKLANPTQVTAWDIFKTLLLLAIPAVLAVIYYGTSLSFQQSLILDHTHPGVPNFWTNALVHNHQQDDSHLIGNIVGYLLLAFPCWILHIYRSLEKRFWTGLALILTVGPLITSASSYIAFYEFLGMGLQNDRGFSGVVGALVGFLLLAILHTFEQKQDDQVAILSVGIYVAYLILGLGVFTERILAIGLGFLLLVGVLISTRTQYVASVAELTDWKNEHGRLSQVLVVATLVSVITFAALLPSDITADGELTNIVAHGAGIMFGMVVASSLRYQDRRLSPEDSAAA